MPISSVQIRACLALAVTLSVGGNTLDADTREPVPKPRKKPQISIPAQVPATKPASAITDVAVISRRDWKAKPPLFAMNGHVPIGILVHHTASPANTKRDIFYKMRSLQAFSQSSAKLGNGSTRKAWADVPYHYYVSHDGRIAEGRDIKFSGDTNTNYDPTGHIQVVLEGNFETGRPSIAQIEALEPLLVALARKWKVPASEIRVHKEVAQTLCPGKYFLELFLDLNDRVEKQLKAQ